MPNKRRRSDKMMIRERLAEEYPGYHPVVAMAKMAHDTKSEQMRFLCHKEIAQYLEPKLAAIKVDTTIKGGTGVLLIKEAPDRQAWIEAAQASMENTMKVVEGIVLDVEGTDG